MVKLLAGSKGTGKTKKLIEMANASIKTTDGHIVFIDDDHRRIFDLHYDIRFVETRDYPLDNYKEFIGFLYGILSQDSDIQEIFIDGLHNMLSSIDINGIELLVERLKELSVTASVDFILSVSGAYDALPESLKELVIFH